MNENWLEALVDKVVDKVEALENSVDDLDKARHGLTHKHPLSEHDR